MIDDGCGMTPEVVERVYEPFFTTKEAGKGTGLGLSQIFALVRQMAGEITIATAIDAGTTVTLYLPRDEAAAPRGDIVEIAPVAPLLPEGLHILVVEDDPHVLAATMGATGRTGPHRHRPATRPPRLRRCWRSVATST